MEHLQDRADRELRDFFEQLLKTEDFRSCPFEFVVFGSYAAERPRPWSDIDLAVVSETFSEMPWSERTAWLRKIARSSGCVFLTPIGVTRVEEEGNDYPSVIKTVREYGRRWTNPGMWE